eukprot:2363359-Amphidinium_carterae.1
MPTFDASGLPEVLTVVVKVESLFALLHLKQQVIVVFCDCGDCCALMIVDIVVFKSCMTVPLAVCVHPKQTVRKCCWDVCFGSFRKTEQALLLGA